MGKDLKGKEIGDGIYQQPNGTYCARFVDKFSRRKSKRSKKLQEVRQWIADATYIDEHSDLDQATDMIVDAWFDYWISIKKQTVRPNTVRNYSERYERNIKDVIGKKLLTEVKPIHCQTIFSKMAEEGYKTTTIYQTRIALNVGVVFVFSNPSRRNVDCALRTLDSTDLLRKVFCFGQRHRRPVGICLDMMNLHSKCPAHLTRPPS